MLWAVVITALLGSAAHILESLLRARRGQGRWAWALAMVGAMAILVASVVVEDRPPVSATGEVDSTVTAAEALSTWWTSVSAEMPTVLESLDSYVIALWLVASLVMTVGLIGGFLRLDRRARSWPRRRVAGHEVLISSDFGPALVGVLTPRIVIPRALMEQGDAAVALVCRHEAEHREKRDTWLLAGAAFSVAALPWNLALWWHLLRLRAAVELDCDKRVVDGGAAPTRYAGLLLRLGAGGEALPVPIPAFVQSSTLLERRLTMLIHGVRRQGPKSTLLSAAAVVVLSVAACRTTAPTLAPAPSVQAAADPSVRLSEFGEAMIFVDGVQLETRDPIAALRGFDRDDIESIEIIKGAAAVNLYGPDAVGGVISIVLKQS
jgi:beta-lactamase regulating signal transducer with metallopeptidase domain